MSVRFAPSPTGRFHLGNLRTAWISHLFSKELREPWVVRFEDIDRPRVVEGAQKTQLEDLAELGLVPDEIVIQSARKARHEALFRLAVDNGVVYPCSCSRKEVQLDLAGIASDPHHDAPTYNGRCRNLKERPPIVHPSLAWRFANPADEKGKFDFIVARTTPDGGDFNPAYHWACAIDDYDGRHSLLVRAADLRSALSAQRSIHDWVNRAEVGSVPYPAVFHASLVTTNGGRRLEKRTQGVTLPELREGGVSPAEIIRRFKESFDLSLLKGRSGGRVWNEALDEINLRQLKFES